MDVEGAENQAHPNPNPNPNPGPNPNPNPNPNSNPNPNPNPNPGRVFCHLGTALAVAGAPPAEAVLIHEREP